MQINSIAIRHYRRIESLELTLPDGAVTLITGTNGAGKSSILDAVAWCMFGRTLARDDPKPIPDDRTDLAVQVETPRVAVRRCIMANRAKTLDVWIMSDTGEWVPLQAETRTKLQAKLEDIIGPYDTWRSSCVFTGDDLASSFAASTDKQRKQLLETMLGFNVFDDMLAKARKHAKAVGVELSQTIAKHAELKGQATAMEALLGGWPDIEEITARFEQAQAERAGAYTAYQAVNQELVELRQHASKLQWAASKAKTDADIMGDDGTCVTCRQPIAPDIKEKILSRVADAERDAASAAANPRMADLEQQVTAMLERIRDLDSSIGQLRMELTAAQGQVEAHERFDAVMRDLTLTGDEMADLRVSEDAWKLLVSVLGWKGARTKLFGDVLAAVERLTNRYLAAMSRYMSVNMAVHDDKLALTVQHEGQSVRGFMSCSSGERKRIAVALLLAMAELSPSARSAALWVDEAFDRLDAEGVAGVCRAVADVSTQRKIVIITHDDAIIDTLASTATINHVLVENTHNA